MEKKNWIYTLIIIIIISIITIGIFTLVNQKENDQTEKSNNKTEKKSNKNIHIAIVNEDQQTTYNGKKINLGEPFIERLSDSNKYKFETVSRSIAENGLKQGTYQVMLVIPKDFSKLAMQLDEKTPSKMTLQYKTAVGQKENVAKETEQVVGDVLNKFNKDLIQIYLTSIIDNLHNAQENVGDIMKRQQNVDNEYSNYLLDPLNDFPSLFTDTLGNSLAANKDITKMMHQYNHSLLSSDSNDFNVDSDQSASSIVDDQSSLFDQNMSAMEKTLESYKSQKDDVNINDYISHLKEVDSELDKQTESQENSKKAYKKAIEDNLKKVKDEVKKEESPFTDKMIDDYREKLTKSMKEELNHNKDLNNALKQIKDDKQKAQDTMIQNLRNTIEDDRSGEDQFYIRNMSNQDLENAGLSSKAIKEYQEILNNVNQFKTDFDKGHPNDNIAQNDYNGEINADDTSKLINEGVDFDRKETIKSSDINHLTIATDSNFDFEGKVYVNDNEYDVKDQDIELEKTDKSYDVEVKGVAKLKANRENQDAFLEDKTMHLQLLFGQANQNKDDSEDTKSSLVDLSINHNLEGQLISGDLNQQLRSLDKFQTQYALYKDDHLSPDAPEIDNDSIADMMVNEVIKDMESFKTDKSALLKKIDGLNESSDKLADDALNNKDNIDKNKKDIEALIKDLSKTEKSLNKEPEKPEIDKDEGKEFTTLSTNLDKEVNQLSERSTKLLSDSQESKTFADSISGELNQLDDNVGKLHASGRSLGVKANDLNKDMSKTEKDNNLFAKDFAKVLKNSKDGDRQNEALKAFMSNPIQKKNLENVLADNSEKDTISSTILVLIMYLIAMMTAYIFSSHERVNGALNIVKQEFSNRNHLWNNVITSAIVTAAGLVEGVIIGAIAMNRYAVMSGYRVKFMFMIMMTMMVFVLINTYLLRQLKSIGMFIIMVVLAMYFVAMNYLNPNNNGSTLNKYSPLSYVDSMIFNYLNAEHPVGIALVVLVALTIIGFILNMFIKHFKKERLI